MGVTTTFFLVGPSHVDHIDGFAKWLAAKHNPGLLRLIVTR